MPSNATTPIAARLPREDAEAIHEIARELGTTTSTVTAGLVRRALRGRRREQVLNALALLEQTEELPPGSRRWRQLVLQAIECVDRESVDETADE